MKSIDESSFILLPAVPSMDCGVEIIYSDGKRCNGLYRNAHGFLPYVDWPGRRKIIKFRITSTGDDTCEQTLKANSKEAMHACIRQYLNDNLEISIEQVTKFGPVEQVKVKLELDGVVVSEDSCDLPDNQLG